MKKQYISPEFDTIKFSFGSIMDDTDDPYIDDSYTENSGSQGGEYQGDLGG